MCKENNPSFTYIQDNGGTYYYNNGVFTSIAQNNNIDDSNKYKRITSIDEKNRRINF